MGDGVVGLAGSALVQVVRVLNLLTVMFSEGSFHLIILELNGQRSNFTFEKCISCGVAVLLLGEGVEFVSSQQDEYLTRVGQLAVSCTHHQLVWHHNLKC